MGLLQTSVCCCFYVIVFIPPVPCSVDLSFKRRFPKITITRNFTITEKAHLLVERPYKGPLSVIVKLHVIFAKVRLKLYW